MFKKEMTILVGKRSKNKIVATDTFYYRFYEVVNKKLEKKFIKKKTKQPTIDIYEDILSEFFAYDKKEKLLTYVEYNTFKPDKEEYFGIKMQNSEKEKLNVYFTFKALDALEKLVKFIEVLKYRDFYEYAINSMEKKEVETLVIRPSVDNKSSVSYTWDNKECYSLRIQKQLGVYYHKNNHIIDEIDLWNICNIIRQFINFNLENHPRYEYRDILRIKFDKKISLEVRDNDLIYQLEKMRILDDLWLVMHGVIDGMPLQEESMSEKEELKRKRIKYLKDKNLTNKGEE